MLSDERKAAARLVHEAIGIRNLALIEDHPGY
jgi:hypothetical protein